MFSQDLPSFDAGLVTSVKRVPSAMVPWVTCSSPEEAVKTSENLGFALSGHIIPQMRINFRSLRPERCAMPRKR